MVKELPPFRYKPAKGCNLDDEMQLFTIEMSLTFLTNLTNLTRPRKREHSQTYMNFAGTLCSKVAISTAFCYIYVTFNAN